MDIDKLYQIKTSFASRTVGKDLILVPVKNNVADMKEIFTLNEVGSFIWENIKEENSTEDIVTLVMEEFDIDRTTAEKDTFDFLSRLSNLLSAE
jgi:hypothetical protein